MVRKIKHEPVPYPRDVAITKDAKRLLELTLHKDPEQRLQLIDFIGWDYYKDDESTFLQKYEAAKKSHEQNMAQEEAKAEEEKLETEMTKMKL